MKKLSSLHIIGLIFILLIGISSFITFSRESKVTLERISVAQLADYGTQNVKSTMNEFKSALNIIKSIASNFEEVKDLHSDRSLAKLEKLSANSPFTDVIIANKEGKAKDALGREYNLTEEKYYQRTILGEYTILNSKKRNSNGNKDIVISAPIIQDGVTVGSVHGKFNISLLSKYVKMGSFQGECYSVIINPEGDYILNAKEKSNKTEFDFNYWTHLQNAEFTDGYRSLASYYLAITNHESGSVIYNTEGDSWVVYFTPLGLNNWYMLQGVKLDIIYQNVEPVRLLVYTLIGKILILFIFLLLIIYNILKKFEREKREEIARYKSLTDNIPGGVGEILVGDTLTLQYANDAFYSLLGYTKQEFFGEYIEGDYLRVIYNKDRVNIMAEIERAKKEDFNVHVEYRVRCKDRSLKWINIGGTIIKEGKHGVTIQAIFTDITKDKLKMIQMLEVAKRDKMTGLYDKVSVEEIIREEVKAHLPNMQSALAVLDIDDFKFINDNYGHHIGDVAIIYVANLINKMVGEDSTNVCGRIGGDEFIVYFPKVSDLAILYKKFEEFSLELRDVPMGMLKQPMTCSTGIVAFSTNNPVAYEELFNVADKNLYASKNAGKGKATATIYDKSIQ